MSDIPSPDKKSGSSFMRFLLFLILAGLVLFALQKMGVKSVNVDEKSEITDDPHPGY